jgi:hypothetical protein
MNPTNALPRRPRFAAAVALLCALACGAALAQTPAPAAAPASASAGGTPDAPLITPTPPQPISLVPSRKDVERVQIADPYIELRTGPGRGFPVSQLETTLTAGGSQKSFRDILLDDYLNRRVQLGAAWGHFKAEPMLKLWTSYRLSETLSIEGTLGQVQGVFSGTDFWHVNLLAEPWSDRRISPFFGVGVGKFKNFPNLSLVGAEPTDAKLANATIGVRYYITERFVARADYTLYTAFVADTRSTEYRAWTLGLSFFF